MEFKPLSTFAQPAEISVKGLKNAVFHNDLREQSPWPSFGRAAIEVGLFSVHAFPMRVRDTRSVDAHSGHAAASTSPRIL